MQKGKTVKFIVSKDRVPRIVADRNGPPAAFAADYLRKFLAVFLLEENSLPENARELHPVAITAGRKLSAHVEQHLLDTGWVARTDVKRYQMQIEQYGK